MPLFCAAIYPTLALKKLEKMLEIANAKCSGKRYSHIQTGTKEVNTNKRLFSAFINEISDLGVFRVSVRDDRRLARGVKYHAQ